MRQSDTFIRLKKAIIRNKDNAEFSKDSQNAILSFSDLTYTTTRDKKETIIFKTLGLDLILNSESAILLLENDGNESKIYEIDQGPLLDRLYLYLDWRIETMNSIKV